MSAWKKLFGWILLAGLTGCQFLPAAPVTPAVSPTVSLGPTPTASTAPAGAPTAAPTALPAPQTTTYPVETAACKLGPFAPIAFLPDNIRLVARAGQNISILNLHTGLEEVFLQPGQAIRSAALSPDGGYLALALDDYSIQFYQVSGKRRLYTLSSFTGPVNSLKFSPRGDRLIAAGEDGWVRMWNLGGKEVWAFQPPLADGAASPQLTAALSPDGVHLATQAGELGLKVWDVQSQAPMLAIKTDFGAFNGADIAFSPDGQSLAWGLGGGPVTLSRLIDGVQIWSGGVYALAFSPDGSLLAYSDADDEGHAYLALRSLAENKTLAVFSLPGAEAGPIWRIVFSADGSLLVAATDQATTFWDVASGRIMLTRSSICPL